VAELSTIRKSRNRFSDKASSKDRASAAFLVAKMPLSSHMTGRWGGEPFKQFDFVKET
jgi:hypothetical protein